MNEPAFDRDGYPTEETLRLMREWDCSTGARLCALLAYARAAWRAPQGRIRKERGNLAFITGGYSGNEAIVTALHANTTFWTICWQMSFRGGKHLLRLPDWAREAEETARG